jgi:hypothetical protein
VAVRHRHHDGGERRVTPGRGRLLTTERRRGPPRGAPAPRGRPSRGTARRRRGAVGPGLIAQGLAQGESIDLKGIVAVRAPRQADVVVEEEVGRRRARVERGVEHGREANPRQVPSRGPERPAHLEALAGGRQGGRGPGHELPPLPLVEVPDVGGGRVAHRPAGVAGRHGRRVVVQRDRRVQAVDHGGEVPQEPPDEVGPVPGADADRERDAAAPGHRKTMRSAVPARKRGTRVMRPTRSTRRARFALPRSRWRCENTPKAITSRITR